MKTHLLALLIGYFSTSFLFAQFPDQAYVYEATVDEFECKFIVGPKGMICGAKYVDGVEPRVYLDSLKFVGLRTESAKPPRQKQFWEYRSQDRDGINLVLGFLTGIPGPNGSSMLCDRSLQQRAYNTCRQVTRRTASLRDRVDACFFSHQIEPTSFPTDDFFKGDFDPLVPYLAWRQCESDLEKTLGERPEIHLVKKGERYRFVISIGNAEARRAISESTGFRDDAFESIDVFEKTMILRVRQLKSKYRVTDVMPDLASVGQAFKTVIEKRFAEYNFRATPREPRRTRATTISEWRKLENSESYWRIRCTLRKAESAWARSENLWNLFTFIDIGEYSPRDKSVRWTTTTEDEPRFAKERILVGKNPYSTAINERYSPGDLSDYEFSRMSPIAMIHLRVSAQVESELLEPTKD